MVRGASIIPDPEAGTLGHMQSRPWPTGFKVEWDDEWKVFRHLIPDIVAKSAGVIAEKRFTGRRHNWVGADTDMRDATKLILRCVGSGREMQKFSDWLWARSESVVERHWSLIAALAEELLHRRSMTGTEIRRFLGQIWGEPGATGSETRAEP
jgi:hypothetical protein